MFKAKGGRGYAGGTWGGTGLTSSAVAGDAATALGYAAAEQVGLRPGDTFAGQTLTHPRAVIVTPTPFGDSTMDGRVDLADLDRYLGGLVAGGGVWSTGDYDYDGTTDVPGDFPLFMRGFRAAGGGEVGALLEQIQRAPLTIEAREALVALVPEPAALAVAPSAAIFCLRRRKRVRVQL